jgi:hypothetical protein
VRVETSGNLNDLGLSIFTRTGTCKNESPAKENAFHFQFCSQCSVVITVDEGRTCSHRNDHEEGLCEECAQAQPGWDDSV